MTILFNNPGALEEGARLAGMTIDHFRRLLTRAVWEGDIDRLDELAGCRCCCWEHTFSDCPARLWNGCRGGQGDLHQDAEEWRKHYGMTENEFYGIQEGT